MYSFTTKHYYFGDVYCKWFGQNWYHTDWEYNGVRTRTFGKGRYQGTEFYFLPGWSYNRICRDSIAFRYFDIPGCIGDKGPGIYTVEHSVAALMQSHVISFLLRAVSPQLAFEVSTVALAPLPENNYQSLNELAIRAEKFKRRLVNTNCLERSFYETMMEGKYQLYASWLHTIEGVIEEKVCTAYHLSKEAIQLVTDDTGTPSGWFPLISNYDTPPELPDNSPIVSEDLLEFIQSHDRLVLSENELTDLKHRLRTSYEAGSGAKVEDEDIDTDPPADDEEDEESEIAVGAHIPIPTETFLEELSVKLEIHPISVYWLLKEGREQKGWRCIPEEKRFTEDTFTVMVLRLLGHQWPKQIDAGELVPDWADKDGIIPLIAIAGKQTLLEKVRDRISADFPNSNVASIEREFAEVVGTSLDKWLTGPFFKRHISQFKKRPIAWQIESIPLSSGTGKRQARISSIQNLKSKIQNRSAFSCLIYYHQLNGDFLPKLRTQYVGPLRSRYETELHTLESIPSDERSADQAGRILQLQNWIEELKAFEQHLSEVAISGFGPKPLHNRLRQLAIDDATLCLKVRWLRRLVEVIQSEPLEIWKQAAQNTELHPDFPIWISEALNHLDRHCAAVSPQPPNAAKLTNDPTSADLAHLICQHARSMVQHSLSLACQEWWAKFDEALLAPLRQQLKKAQAETKQLKDELEQLGTQRHDVRRDEIKQRQATLKAEIKDLKETQEQRTHLGEAIRKQIETWKCLEAETWEPWLSAQLLYDAISSLDGRRTPPQTVAEFLRGRRKG